MPLSLTPDLSSSRRMLATAAVVTLAVCAFMVWQVHDITTTLGDTDDAMRLVMVRDLMHGRGWYSQWIGRLQPPLGYRKMPVLRCKSKASPKALAA